jgi:hypothetical protein
MGVPGGARGGGRVRIRGGELIFGMRRALVHVVGLYTGGGLYSGGAYSRDLRYLAKLANTLLCNNMKYWQRYIQNGGLAK